MMISTMILKVGRLLPTLFIVLVPSDTLASFLRGDHHYELREPRELKIPIGVPVYNPGICSARYAAKPQLDLTRRQRRDLALHPAVVSATTTCFTCGTDNDNDDTTPDRDGGDDTGGNNGGIPIDDGPPPPPLPPPPPPVDNGDGGGGGGGGGDVPSLIMTRTDCLEVDEMLVCPYDMTIEGTPYKLECFCVRKEEDAMDATNMNAFHFECLPFEVAPADPVPDRSGTDGGGYENCNLVPYLNQNCPDDYPGHLGVTSVTCPTDGDRPWTNSCIFQCDGGLQVQCLCGGGIGVTGENPTWVCRDFRPLL